MNPIETWRQQLAETLAESRSDRKLPDWNVVDERARTFLNSEQVALLQHIEPGAHGAGGRHWRRLGETIEAARQADRSESVRPN